MAKIGFLIVFHKHTTVLLIDWSLLLLGTFVAFITDATAFLTDTCLLIYRTPEQEDFAVCFFQGICLHRGGLKVLATKNPSWLIAILLYRALSASSYGLPTPLTVLTAYMKCSWQGILRKVVEKYSGHDNFLLSCYLGEAELTMLD